jgi:glyoxylase-like metal-dependent hydrolase (beta-lactamase superfamily II)
MRVTSLEKHLHLVDVETGGVENFVASYILKGKRVIIIETGPSSSTHNLLSAMETIRLAPEDIAYVAVSHIHLDHGGGVGTLLKHLPNAKAIVHPRGAPHLAHPEKLWEQSKAILGKITDMYGTPEPVPEDRIIAGKDGAVFDVGDNVRLQVIETVGHASHHQSYYETLSQTLFPGDAAGVYLNQIDVVVPTSPPPLRLDLALTSIDKLIAIKPKALCYSHFGRSVNAVEKLEAYKAQLKLWAAIAKEGLDKKESVETIRKRITERDANMRRALEHLKAHPVLSETVLNESVAGVVDYVAKYGFESA